MRHLLNVLFVVCIAGIATFQSSKAGAELPPGPEVAWNITPAEALAKMEAALKPVRTISADVSLSGKEFGKLAFQGKYVGDLTTGKYRMTLKGATMLRPRETCDMLSVGDGKINWQDTFYQNNRFVITISRPIADRLNGHGLNPMLCFKTVRSEVEFTGKGNGRYANEEVHVLIGAYKPEYVERLTKIMLRAKEREPQIGGQLLRQLQAIKQVRVYVGKTDFLPRGYETVGDGGVLEGFHFSKLQINGEIDPDAFTYIAPEGATAVNMDKLFED